MTDPECVFCQIIAGNVSANFIYSDQSITVFEDINPVAPIHYLIVPNKHIPSLNQLKQEDVDLFSKLFFVAKDLAAQAGIAEEGYRLMINTGENGRQTVPHLHMHLIGGKKLLGRLAS